MAPKVVPAIIPSPTEYGFLRLNAVTQKHAHTSQV